MEISKLLAIDRAEKALSMRKQSKMLGVDINTLRKIDGRLYPTTIRKLLKYFEVKTVSELQKLIEEA